MIMDGAEEKMRRSKNPASIHVPRRASLIKSMCGKFILDFEKCFMRSPTPVMHQLKHGESSSRVAKDFAISKGSALNCRLPHH
jgi:hypothetical protein